jgi:glycosyltransferase involved in cell wall biosynthesis
VAGTDGLCVVNASFSDAPVLRKREAIFTPPPLERRQFVGEGGDARAALGIDRGRFVVGIIGKVVPGRGFEAAVETVAIVRKSLPDVALMIIGHDNTPHRSHLDELARSHDLSLLWAGYHETDLADYYRAADVMLFTAPGSDEGHRAILEEMGCGVAVATYPIAGVDSLLGPLADRLIAADPNPESLAKVVTAIGTSDRVALRAEVLTRVRAFEYGPAAERLLDLYQALLNGSR